MRDFKGMGMDPVYQKYNQKVEGGLYYMISKNFLNWVDDFRMPQFPNNFRVIDDLLPS